MRCNKLQAAAMLISVSALTACREAPRKAEASARVQAIEVPVIAAAEAEWPSVYEAVGTVRARTSAAISSKIMGYVREVKVATGQSVAAGQTLVTIDTRDLDAAVREAQAGREEALSARGEVDHAVDAAQANLNFAKVTFQRIEELFEKKSVSNQEYDEAKSRLQAAQAAYDMAVSKRGQIAARIQRASEALASAEVTRGYSEIRAPFAGVVTEKPVEPGSMAVPGTPLLTVEQSGALRLEVPVEESFLPEIHVGSAVTVALDSLDRKLDARVSEMAPLVDPASRAFVVKIDLPAIPRLRPGVYGRASFSRGTRRVLAVPAAAVAQDGQLQSVMVVEQGIARTRLVTLGQRNGDRVEVLSGLSAGERVVSQRQPNLADGARVEERP